MTKTSGLLTSVIFFEWKKLGFGTACHAGESLLRGPRAFPCHSHDFHEVFWVDRGRGVHFINGESHPLGKGQLVFIRPGDVHGFASDRHGIHVRNVAISPKLHSDVRRRFFPEDDQFWGDADRGAPSRHHLDPASLARLGGDFDELRQSACDEFHGMRFLLNLLAQTGRAPQHDRERPSLPAADLPPWLTSALERFGSSPEHLSGGTRELARLAGRSPEYVARTLRSRAGLTPTDWVNGVRLHRATVLLRTTDRKILDISLECGFESLGHFYSLFQARRNCTPRSYRKRFHPRLI